MASTGTVQLLDSSVSGATTGAKKSVEQGAEDFALVVITSNQSSVNVSVQLQHSPDGVNWLNKGTPIAVTADGLQEEQDVGTGVMYPNVRVDVAHTAGSADLDVRLYFDPKKR